MIAGTIAFEPTASMPQRRTFRRVQGGARLTTASVLLVDRERLLRSFHTLIGIPALGMHEGKMARHLIERFDGLGFVTSHDDAHLDPELQKEGAETGNLFATLSGDPRFPSMTFAVHMDGFGEQQVGIRPEERGGRLYPAGNTILKADNDAYKASLLEVAEIIKAQGLPHGDIHVVATIGEELGILGSSRIEPQQLKGDLGFSIDGDHLEAIIHGGVQISIFRHNVLGRAAHTIYSEQGVNTNVISANALAAVGFPVDGIMDRATNTRLILGRIDGGQGAAAVSARTAISGNVRGMSPRLVDETLARIAASLSAEAERYGAQVEDHSFKACDGYNIPTDAPVVQFAQEALALTGITPKLDGTCLGGSDANPLNAKGSPMVLLGMDIKDEHVARDDARGVQGENLGIESFVKFTQALLTLTQLPTLYERVA